jgi:hypothetical protein
MRDEAPRRDKKPHRSPALSSEFRGFLAPSKWARICKGVGQPIPWLNRRRDILNKLAMALVAIGFVSFSGIAKADSSSEKTTTTDTDTAKTTKKVKKKHTSDGKGNSETTSETKTKTEAKTPAN